MSENEMGASSLAEVSEQGGKALVYYVVRDLNNLAEHLLLTSDTSSGFSADPMLGLDWADNDTIFVNLPGPGRARLLTLDTEKSGKH